MLSTQRIQFFQRNNIFLYYVFSFCSYHLTSLRMKDF